MRLSPHYNANKPQTPDNILTGQPREGATLLQGLLVCGVCGRRMTIRYRINKAIVPSYLCNGKKRQGLTGCSCFSFRADLADPIIEQKAIGVLTPANVSIALKALAELKKETPQ